MSSLVGKKNRPQIKEITHLRYRTYDDIADLMKLNTGLRTLELNFFDVKLKFKKKFLKFY